MGRPKLNIFIQDSHMADISLPVVSQQPSTGSPSAGEPGVHTGRNDDETDQKKLTGKELGKGKNKNFVPLTKSSTKKKAGEKPGEEEEEGEMMENKKDGCGCKSKSKKLDKKKCDSLTPARIDACWAGYKKVGMKNKGGKQVPDCVPIGGKKKTDADGRVDLKCGKGAISKGEKCTKGQSSAVKNAYGEGLKKRGNGGLGSRYGGGPGGTAKAVGLGALETVKWTSGYNIGKAVAGGKEAKNKNALQKTGGIAASTFFFGPQAGLGAARRYGAFGETDLEANKRNYKRGDSVWASGFKFDGKALSTEAMNLAATDTTRAKKKKNAQGQPKNKIMAGTRNT